MASRIEIAAACTPIHYMDDAYGVGVHTLEDTVAKTLRGGGSISVASWGTSLYVPHNKFLLETVGNSGPKVNTSNETITTTPTAVGCVFIRHSGVDNTYAATTALVYVRASVAGVDLCALGPGESIVLPRCEIALALRAESGLVLCEYAIITAT